MIAIELADRTVNALIDAVKDRNVAILKRLDIDDEVSLNSMNNDASTLAYLRALLGSLVQEIPEAREYVELRAQIIIKDREYQLSQVAK